MIRFLMIRFLTVALLAVLPVPWTMAQTGAPAQANALSANTKWIKGSYEYGFLDSDVIRGHEDWTITVHPDGSRTVEAFVDLREQGHQSNVILRVDQNFRPLDTYANFWRFGAYGGAARFWLETRQRPQTDILNGNIIGPNGNATLALEVPEAFSLRVHPVITEGWQVLFYDHTKPSPQTVPLYNMVTTSGEGIKGIGQMVDNEIIYHGRETVTVPAGTFEADHYTFYFGRYDIWLWGDDQVLVRYVAKANNREYRLTKLEVGPR
ncbi:MAG: hypothetical protein RIC29_02705 [Rhodospirillaceae bacterium]